MRLSHIFAFLVFAAAAPLAARAQALDSVYTVGSITVTANREGVAPERSAQRVTVIGQEDARAAAAVTVADLLEHRAGLFIRRNGTGLATVSLRGGTPSQTLLLIDGMRLSNPQLGQFDLSLLPAFVFGAVEVAHGPLSSLYGSDGMAGVINMRRRRPLDDRIELLTEVGAFGRRLVSAAGSFSGTVSGTIAFESGHTDGDFPFLNEALFPARTTRRKNADRTHRSVFASANTRLGSHRLRGAMLYADTRQGLPGVVGSPQEGERQWDEHLRIWAEDDMAVGQARLSLRGFVHRASIRYVNPQLAVDDTGIATSSALEAEVRRPFADDLLLSVGGSAGFSRAEHPSLAASAAEYHGAGYLSASWTHGLLRVYPAVRADMYSGRDREVTAAFSPRLGLNIQPKSSLPLYVKANAGTAFRMPTFNDRFWQPGGNPDLLPERSRSAEVGVYLDGASVKAELTGFAAVTSQQIQWITDAIGVWTPINVARSVSRGLEASLEWRPARLVRSGILYSYVRASDRSDPSSPEYGRQLRYVPVHQIKGHVSLAAGPARMDLNAKYLGRRFVTTDESESLPSVLVVDAQAGAVHDFGAIRAGLYLTLENVTDVRYAVIQNYPMPPRHVRVRLLLETGLE